MYRREKQSRGEGKHDKILAIVEKWKPRLMDAVVFKALSDLGLDFPHPHFNRNGTLIIPITYLSPPEKKIIGSTTRGRGYKGYSFYAITLEDAAVNKLDRSFPYLLRQERTPKDEALEYFYDVMREFARELVRATGRREFRGRELPKEAKGAILLAGGERIIVENRRVLYRIESE
ncbi:hypothetical protein [Pyrococcus kukulkanii]|uniref:hypothetical protein n=1 Tax=Pyrococcus kukulkanii TaxID=1609559 RepID=UPI003561DF32